MNAEVFRHIYNYHLNENHRIWDTCLADLTYEQFVQPVEYSHGSVRNQIVHLMEVEDTWFSELRGANFPEPFAFNSFDDRALIREHWNGVEQNMHKYLQNLRDEMLFDKPITLEEDKDLIVWQVLLHVINHATDHRAQILRLVHDYGVRTSSQDYIFYVYEHP
jgi:uncharacterized damage-inducible protein DinB